MDNLNGVLMNDPSMDPKALALMQAGFAGLQASGPSRMPTSLGQVIGQAGNAGIGTYMQATQMQQQQKAQLIRQRLIEAQAQEHEQKVKMQKSETEFFARPDIRQMLNAGDIRGVYAQMPNKSAASMAQIGALVAKEKPQPFNLSPGATRYTGEGVPVVTAPTADQDKGTWSDPYSLGGATVQKHSVTGQIRAAVPRPPITNVSTTVNAGDKKYSEERSKNAAQRMDTLEKSAESAHKSMLAMDRFLASSPTGMQGNVQPILTGVQNFLATFGYESKNLTSVRQMEQAIGDVLQNKMAELGARGLTDRDMEILRNALPRVNIDRASRENVARIVKKGNQAAINEYMAQRDEERRIYPDIAKNIPEPAWLKQYKAPKKSKAPEGVNQQVWDAMTAEERALWQN